MHAGPQRSEVFYRLDADYSRKEYSKRFAEWHAKRCHLISPPQLGERRSRLRRIALPAQSRAGIPSPPPT
ncbi:hypothetical protein F0726_01823 [Acidithiobacillus caldus]|nr:hypothetical protein F0726_01823 [Acidithiobacillus caldus]